MTSTRLRRGGGQRQQFDNNFFTTPQTPHIHCQDELAQPSLSCLLTALEGQAVPFLRLPYSPTCCEELLRVQSCKLSQTSLLVCPRIEIQSALSSKSSSFKVRALPVYWHNMVCLKFFVDGMSEFWGHLELKHPSSRMLCQVFNLKHHLVRVSCAVLRLSEIVSLTEAISSYRRKSPRQQHRQSVTQAPIPSTRRQSRPQTVEDQQV